MTNTTFALEKTMKIKPGDSVTCLHTEAAYYSDYGPNKGKIIQFKPGMLGTVASIAPKVTMPAKGNTDPRYDFKDDFLVVDYMDENNEKQRVGLNFCNAKLIDDTYEIVVRFKRSFSDDAGVIEEEGEVTPQTLVKQLVRELQAAYDHADTAIAGSFQVVSGPTFN